MNSFEIIWRWATLLLAEILNVSASVAERILRSQPRWIAHLRLMADNLRQDVRAPDGDDPQATSGGAETPDADADRQGLQQILESYAILNRALRNLEARGLALDDDLTDRMKRDWSPESIIGYLQSCEAQLKQGIAETLNEAAAALDAAVPGSPGNGRGGAVRPPTGRPKPAAARRENLAS